MRIVVCTALGLAAVTGAIAWPTSAAPVLYPVMRPGFAAVICSGGVPQMDLAFLDGVRAVPGGSVIRVADVAVSRADQAEMMFKLGLLQGHLMIGRTLIEAGQKTLALPHFGHPVRELYDDIKPGLQRRGLSAFDGDLIALEALAAGKPGDAAMWTQYDKVMQIVDAVRATVPAELRDNQVFALGVLGEIANAAAGDYGESIEGGRIAKPVEYHDSRGYLMYADRELARLEARPELKSSAALPAARARIGEMQAIVAPLLPPARPIRTVAQFKAIVAQYKKAVTATGA